jgi:hypothetical protein
MGQNTIGLPKGIATALDEIARNVQFGAKRKFKTEEDYFQAFMSGSKPPKPKDPLRLRLWKRAHAKWKEHKAATTPRALMTVQDMVDFLLIEDSTHFPSSLLAGHVGKDIARHNMAMEAIEIVANMQKDDKAKKEVLDDLQEYKDLFLKRK